MSVSKPISDFARLTLHRLTELGLPPTPENYTEHYYVLSEETPPPSASTQSCNEMMQAVKSVLQSITDRTTGLASELGKQNLNLQQSIDDLGLAEERAEIFRLLQLVITQATSIQGTVEHSRDDLLSTRQAIDHLSLELQETRLQLHEDALTGAQNRRAMDAVLAREVARSLRTGSRLSVAMIDIDHFKRVNDDHGHDAGDKLLLHTTMIAKSVLRDADVLIRYGGEEFLIILPDSDTKGAEFVLNRLKQVINKSPLIYESQKISITFSGGIAQLKTGENGQALVLRADSALYAAKHAGRNCVMLAKE